MPCHCGNFRQQMQIQWVVCTILHLDDYVIGMQFKIYSAVGKYRKNSFGGNSNPIRFEREGFASMSANSKSLCTIVYLKAFRNWSKWASGGSLRCGSVWWHTQWLKAAALGAQWCILAESRLSSYNSAELFALNRIGKALIFIFLFQ